MKTKTVNTLENVGTIAHNFFPILEGTTKNGGKCLAIVTDLRLNGDDFKSLMRDIQLAEGYGFVKYYEESKKRYISATKIDSATLQSLASQYNWTAAEQRATKKSEERLIAGITKTPTKAITTKQTKQAKQTALTDIKAEIDPKEFQQYLAFKKMLALEGGTK